MAPGRSELALDYELNTQVGLLQLEISQLLCTSRSMAPGRLELALDYELNTQVRLLQLLGAYVFLTRKSFIKSSQVSTLHTNTK